MNPLHKIISHQKTWSKKTFGEAGERGGQGCANHLIHEAKELAENPNDIMEGADCFILLMDWMWREGYSIYDLLSAVQEKQKINEQREWGQPDKDGVIEHIEK